MDSVARAHGRYYVRLIEATGALSCAGYYLTVEQAATRASTRQSVRNLEISSLQERPVSARHISMAVTSVSERAKRQSRPPPARWLGC
jgi:hypothetical protein